MVNPLVAVSVSLKPAPREPELVMVTEPLRVSPGFMLSRSNTALLALEFVWVSEPVLKALAEFTELEVKSAPEPTASAAAAARPARGTRTR